MLSNFLIVAAQVATLFLLMGTGFLITKLGKLTVKGTGELSFICLYVVTPCLMMDSLQTDLTPGLLKNIGIEVAVVILLFVVTILLSRPFFPSRDKDTRPVLQFGLIFANVGFMGFPLIKASLGDSAMIYAAFFLIVFTAVHWTYGVALMGGKMSIVKALLNPGMFGLYLGLPLLLTGWRLPSFIGNAVGFVADLNTPLAMIVIGSQMARSDMKEILSKGRLFVASAIRLILFPAVCMLIMLPMKLDPTLFAALSILSAAPTAGVTSMFAEMFKKNTAAGAHLVSLSTLLSLITLPVFASIAKYLAGF